MIKNNQLNGIYMKLDWIALIKFIGATLVNKITYVSSVGWIALFYSYESYFVDNWGV